jgi:hypothetical protein
VSSPSEFRFGAFLIYSPRGASPTSVNSRKVRDFVKKASPEFLEKAARAIREHHDSGGFGDLFSPGAVLVPAPRSAPLVRGGLWPGRRIADALVKAGLGSDVQPLLVRTEAVPKAAYAAPGERPTVETHLRTLSVELELGMPERLIVIDDFITKGEMMWACAATLAGVFPEAEVSGFAMVRTMGLIPDVDTVLSPCLGTISRGTWGVDRHP